MSQTLGWQSYFRWPDSNLIQCCQPLQDPSGILDPSPLSLSLPPPPFSQFHIPNPTTANYVRTVQFPLASMENITKMVAFDGEDFIFAMTPSRVSIEYNKFHTKKKDMS